MLNCLNTFILLLLAASSESSDSREALAEALPTWLASKSFQIHDRLEVKFDGSPEAGEILKSSESSNRLLFKDAENWRALREYPFTQSSREFLKLDAQSYSISSRNRKVPAKEDLSEAYWLQIVSGPFKLARAMGIQFDSDNLSDWFDEIRKSEKAFETDSGASLKVEESKADNIYKLRITLRGPYYFEGKTKALILNEWTLEQGVEVNEDRLSKSLLGGSS